MRLVVSWLQLHRLTYALTRRFASKEDCPDLVFSSLSARINECVSGPKIGFALSVLVGDETGEQ